MPKRSPRRHVPEPPDKVIRVRCPEDLKYRMTELARLNGLDLSKFIREASEHYLEHLTAGGDRHVVLPSSEQDVEAQS